jgi:hypothetical protein
MPQDDKKNDQTTSLSTHFRDFMITSPYSIDLYCFIEDVIDNDMLTLLIRLTPRSQRSRAY